MTNEHRATVAEQRWRQIRRLAPAIAGLAGATFVALTLEDVFYSAATAGWLYLLVVLPVTLRWGRTEGLVTALVAGLLLFGLLIEPNYTWAVNDPLDLARLGVSVGAMLLAVLLVDYANRGRLAAERRLAVVAEREEALRRFAFLAEASSVLAGSLDYETTLANVARLSVPELTDLCVVDVVEGGGSIRRVAAVHADPQKADLAERLRCFSPDPANWDHPIARALAGGRVEFLDEVPDHVLALLARDGEHLAVLHALRPVCILVVPLVARGRTLGTLTFQTTTPERHYGPAEIALAEELGRRAALAVDNARLYHDAQVAIRVRDNILATASHELRTPLGHVKGFVSALRQPDIEWDEQTRAEFLAGIEQEADRLAKLIGNLLDMSRIESSGVDISERIPSRPCELVREGVDRVRALLAGRPLLIEVPVTLPLVPVEVSQIERVIANLVENAAKYSVPGGTISITAERRGEELELRVEDDGPGIPPEYREQVFDKFFRIQNAARFGIPGTGLGLAICRAIVAAHGGRIWLEESTRGGACFVMRLPLTPDGAGGR